MLFFFYLDFLKQMDDDLMLCMSSCQNTNNSGTPVGNDSYDIECITQCTQQHTTLYEHTSEKYNILINYIR